HRDGDLADQLVALGAGAAAIEAALATEADVGDLATDRDTLAQDRGRGDIGLVRLAGAGAGLLAGLGALHQGDGEDVAHAMGARSGDQLHVLLVVVDRPVRRRRSRRLHWRQRGSPTGGVVHARRAGAT